MEEREEEQFPANIIPALKRHKVHLVLAIVPLLVIGLAIVLLIPPVYRATGYIMVETQQIPTTLVKSTVTSAATEQIDVIRQRVMTREKIIGIIKKYNNYFAFDESDPIQQSSIINSFRNNVEIQITSAKSGYTTVAIGFSVSFDSDRSDIAAKVATDLVKLFLNENLKARTERASETTEFLKAEAEKMRLQLEKTEKELADFKNQNKESLPEHLNLYVTMREEARKNLSGVNESILENENQIQLLKNQLSLSTDQGSKIEGANELSKLIDEYNRLSLEYQPNHPDLILLREKIDAFEKGAVQNSPYRSQSEILIQSQILNLESKRERLQNEKKIASDKLSDLENRIIKIPQVERGFTVINRNYKTVLEQYQSLQAKAQSAEMAESLEQEQKAERFILLETPIQPTSPYKPNRKKLLVLAFAASFGLPIAVVVLLGFLDKSIRSGDAVTRELGSAPLIEIPFIRTEEEIKKLKRHTVYFVLSVILVFILGILIFHFAVIPLDVFVVKAMSRFGL